jgi:outer membrane protein assembly factor BamB
VSGESVYAGTAAGKFFCVDRHSGAPRWIFVAGEGRLPAPAVGGGTVYLATPDGRLFAIEE